MHFALLAATLAAGIHSTAPKPPVTAAVTAVTVPVTVSAPRTRRPAWEPPGYPLDDHDVASLLQSVPRSGDGGG